MGIRYESEAMAKRWLRKARAGRRGSDTEPGWRREIYT